MYFILFIFLLFVFVFLVYPSIGMQSDKLRSCEWVHL